MNWSDDLARMGAEFSRAIADSRATRILVYAIVAAIVVALLASAFAEMTRPRIYVVQNGAPEREQ